ATFLLGSLAEHAGIALERNQRLAGIGPVLHLFDGDVVNRLTAGAALKESARNVDHVPRAGALVDQGRAAAPTKAAHRARFLLLETLDLALPRRDAKALAPGVNVGGVHGAMRKPASPAVIVPSPERGVLHLELHGPAQALACDNGAAREFPGFHRMCASLKTCGKSPHGVKCGRRSDAPGRSLIPPLTVEVVAVPTFSALCQVRTRASAAYTGFKRSYSITSSARTSSEGGMVKPSAFAVLRLITSSNLVGCCTGRLAGPSPLRIRSMYDALRRKTSLWLLH